MNVVEINPPLAPVQKALTEFDKVTAGLTELSVKYKDTVYPVSTPQGMEEAKAARLAIREPRYAVGRLLKAAKNELAGIKKDVEERADQITAALLVLEDPIDAQIKAEDDRRALEKRAKEEAEELRISTLRQRLTAISSVAPSVAGGSADEIKRELAELSALDIDASWDEFAAHAADAKQQAVSTLITMHAKAVAAEEAQAVIAAQQAELQALRQQLESQRLAQLAEIASQVEAQRVAAEATQHMEPVRAKVPEPVKQVFGQNNHLLGRQVRVESAWPLSSQMASEHYQEAQQQANAKAKQALMDASLAPSIAPVQADTTIDLFDVDFQPTDMEIVRAVADRFCVSADLALHWICSISVDAVNQAIAEAA